MSTTTISYFIMKTRRVIVPYSPALKEYARHLRNNSTLTEILLWNRLSGRQMRGYDFHRQKPLGTYIVDFFCNELMLAIEIDGNYHIGREEHDMQREQRLARMGVRFLRFTTTDITERMQQVLQTIALWIDNNTPVDKEDS